jgi:hypothetical protein
VPQIDALLAQIVAKRDARDVLLVRVVVCGMM